MILKLFCRWLCQPFDHYPQMIIVVALDVVSILLSGCLSGPLCQVTAQQQKLCDAMTNKVVTSSRIEGSGRERSRPRVKGTMQKAHRLSQPRMMLSHAPTCPAGLAGSISSYVSVRLRATLMAPAGVVRRLCSLLLPPAPLLEVSSCSDPDVLACPWQCS